MLDRRSFLQAGAALVTGAAAARFAHAQDTPAAGASAEAGKPTEFQVACMTLPFSAFPFAQALGGIKRAGFEYVALGTTHVEDPSNNQRVPILAPDAGAARAKEVGKQCRDAGLEPLMMFSAIYPENPKGLEVLAQRLKQAGAAGIPQVLTFGHTEGGNRAVWTERFKQLGPIAADEGALLVVKQHGGSTGTGEACAEIVRDVAHPHVWVNYDAGNVMDYLNVDPIPDIQKCAKEVRSFCLKDHRNWPKDQDCGPGWGEIDHYRLLEPVSRTGLKMPLCFENIYPPVIPRPATLEGTEKIARQCREYIETVIAGVRAIA
ncbi:MAG: TIM barrel protein [Planctomycetales bacterium]